MGHSASRPICDAIPNDVLDEILEDVVCEDVESASIASLRLSHVSKKLRCAALNNAKLWTTIHFHDKLSSLEFVDECLLRSRGAALDVVMVLDTEAEQKDGDSALRSFLSKTVSHIQRWKAWRVTYISTKSVWRLSPARRLQAIPLDLEKATSLQVLAIRRHLQSSLYFSPDLSFWSAVFASSTFPPTPTRIARLLPPEDPIITLFVLDRHLA